MVSSRTPESLAKLSVLVTLAVLPFSKTLVEITAGTALGFWALHRILSKTKSFPIPRIPLAAYAVFLTVTALSLIQVPGPDQITAWRGLFKWLKYLGLFLLCADFSKDPAFSRRLFKTFLFSCLLLTLNGFWQMIHGTDFIKNYSVDIPGRLARMKSSLDSPNDLAAFYFFAIPLAFEGWFREKKWTVQSAAWAGLLALFCVADALTFSRSGLFSLAAALFFCLLSRGKIKTLAAGAVFLGIFLVSSPILHQNFIGSLKFNDKTIAERLRFWKTTERMIETRPLTGHGVNTYYRVFERTRPATEKYRGYAHNAYLQMWSEIGLVGLVSFLIALVLGLARSANPALRVGLLAYALQGFVDTNFYAFQVSFLFWIFWGVFWTCE